MDDGFMVSVDEVRMLARVSALLLDCFTTMAMCEFTGYELRAAHAYLSDHYQEIGRVAHIPMPLTSLSLVHRDLTVFRSWLYTKLPTEKHPVTLGDIAQQQTQHMYVLHQTTFYGEDTDPEHRRLL